MPSPADGPRPAPSRAHWPVRVLSPGEEPGDDLSALTTAEERLAMVWELSRRMWLLTGRSWPSGSRDAMPIHIARRT